jgi:hypothetical protein
VRVVPNVSRDSEVENLGLAERAAGQEQVGRLEVAVDDALSVQNPQPHRHAAGQGERVLDAERAQSQTLVERLALEPLHDQVRFAS